MKIRKYKPTDCVEIVKLFYETVHTVNAKDYTKIQLDVCATGNVDTSTWNNSFLEHNTLVAVESNTIVGFGDMDNNGYLDRLYVHKDYQSKGIATDIVNELEKQVGMYGVSLFTTYASITAKQFFENQGYIVVRENTIVRNDVELTNFLMEKYSLK